MPPLRALLRLEKRSDSAEISIVLSDDAFIQDLNKRWRGVDQPTDVLSFAQEDDPDLLGDIVISLPTAARQAERAGWPLASETALLAVHGLLHLLGYNDQTLEGAQEMQRKTVQTLLACGITLPAGNHPFFMETSE
jgi:probable rRNA maturation factor